MSQTDPDESLPLVTRGPHHLAVVVIDLARAVHFYEKVLALKVLKRWPASDGLSERSVWFELGTDTFLAVERFEGTAVALAGPETEALPARPGLHLLALSIRREDRRLWRARLRRLGHPVIHETAYTLYCFDPEGNRIGLSHWPSPDLAEPASVP